MEERAISILELLQIKPSPRSLDYVKNKTQFHLHHLLTEQRHRFTWNLSQVIKKDVEKGLRLLLDVDEDIVRKLESLAEDEVEIRKFEQAVQAIVQALQRGKKVFFYGCGSTGRLAKFMESCLWRPFWQKLKRKKQFKRVYSILPSRIEDRLIGEMTGGDRALISALEGFEDLEIIGQLQLEDRKIGQGDVVFCVTEGGETSSVIGAILAAAEKWGKNETEAKNYLYFVYNNPDQLLEPLDRSRRVLANPAITKINLTTGPQAITGSTRMQATTIETFVLGFLLEKSIFDLLASYMNKSELAQLGFKDEPDFKRDFRSFAELHSSLISRSREIASLSSLEARTYQRGKRTNYLAKRALLTVFIDGAERSPTFHLAPLDPVTAKRRRCLFQVWTEARNHLEAWQKLLGRKFRGLDYNFYQPSFVREIHDLYLKEVALQSLLKAGQEQQDLYDFSFSEENIRRRSPRRGDLSLMVGLREEIKELDEENSCWWSFAQLSFEKKARLALVFIDYESEETIRKKIKTNVFLKKAENVCVPFSGQDPLGLREQVILKMLLNAHSTAVMALQGRIVGNTMTAVNPSNLKLIGRATYLIMNHVNDTVNSDEWWKKYGSTPLINYAEANALLFNCLESPICQASGRSEVELSIVRALEALRLRKFVPWERAIKIVEEEGLENYLSKYNPRLRSI